MKASRLGFLSNIAIIAAIITGLIIAVSAFTSGGLMYSPGTLNAKPGKALGGVSSHAEIAGNCKACHVAPWETISMDDRCSYCHVDVALELLNPTSVHGRMMKIDPKAKCRTCHSEHHGPDALLTVLEGWQFPHDVARFSLKSHQLTAKKEPFLCADCHGKDVTQFDVLTCTKCHISMNMTFMVNHEIAFGDHCLECHDGVDRYGHSFDHNKFAFKLNGRHAAVKCSQCHTLATTATALQLTSQACSSCHAKDDAHKGSLGTDCASCHTPDGWKPSTFDHNRSDFKLNGAHMQVTCEQCHVNGVFKGTPKDCFSCHKQIDPHLGQFGTACEKCHTTNAWKLSQFDHDTTEFKLIGLHKNVDCQSCHINGVFANTPKDCFACHAKADSHNGQLGTNCATCHVPSGWNNSIFDHNASAFPLTGKHTQLVCTQCHIARQYKIPTDCVSCHAESAFHMGAFGTNCVQCHTTTGWLPAPFIGTHFTALGQNFLDHHGATCKTCHTITVHDFTCLACHKTNPIEPPGALPNVFTSITPSNIQVGNASAVTVSLNNIPVQGYASTEFTCTYDPAFVDVSNISVGTLFGPDSVSTISGPQNGNFILAIAGSDGKKASSSGTVFTFNAKGLQAGTTTVECKARVSEGLNTLHSIGSLPATMTITGIIPSPTAMPSSASVNGKVIASKMVTIRLYNPDHSIAATGTTNPDGAFNITVQGGTYTITASAEGFLGAQGSVTLTDGSSDTKSTVSLIPGDVDTNGVINQLDALTIGMNYNNTIPASADLNNDGAINVLDLGILIENYGKSGALLWP